MKPIILILIITAVFLPFAAYAQVNPCVRPANIGACVSQIYLWSLGVAATAAVVMMIWGGYLIMTAAGNGEQASKGKSYFASSIAGIVLLMASYLILSLINPDLTNFQLTVPPISQPNTTPQSPRGN